jgi:hypothetical protein
MTNTRFAILNTQLPHLLVLLVAWNGLPLLLTPVLAFIPDNIRGREFVLQNSWLVPNLLFALVILIRSGRNKPMAVPVVILSAIAPLYGGIFFLLTQSANSNENDHSE